MLLLISFKCRLPTWGNDSSILSLPVALQGIDVEWFLLLAFLLVLRKSGKSLRRIRISTFPHTR